MLLYIALLCLSLYNYYEGYYLLESGLIIKDIFLWVVPCLLLLVAYIYYKKGVRQIKGWQNYRDPVLLAILFTGLLAVLFLGFIPFVNSNFGTRQNISLDAIFINKKRETGRGGGNEQFYYKFYAFDSINVYNNYILRSPKNIEFDKRVHLELTKGSLGILYKK
jgi:hypothetical protein